MKFKKLNLRSAFLLPGKTQNLSNLESQQLK